MLTNTHPPVRVLQINSLLTGGGTDLQCVRLADSLRREGESVWILGPPDREVSRLVQELKLPLVPVTRPGPAKLGLILAAARFIRQTNIQVVHGHHGRDLWPTILSARLSGRRPRVVLTRHLAKSPSSWFSRRFLLAHCDALIAVSQFVAKLLREGVYEPDSPEPERHARPPLHGDHTKIHVLYGGLDTERYRPQDATAQRRAWGLAAADYAFGVVGGYDLPRGKGQREFLAAAARIRERAPRARFLIVGRGSLRETLERDLRRLGLTDRAWLTPYCEDMVQGMNALDCLVHPQVGTEALAWVVLEAFACGKPVIGSALDGIPEAFAMGGWGRLVPPESVEALAAALLAQAHTPGLDPDAAHRLHARIQETCSLERLGQNTARLYRKLLAGRAAAPAGATP